MINVTTIYLRRVFHPISMIMVVGIRSSGGNDSHANRSRKYGCPVPDNEMMTGEGKNTENTIFAGHGRAGIMNCE